MDEAKWNNAKVIFAAALEHDASQRDAFLRTACGQDESLRLEVESLLSAYHTSDGLSTPPWLDHARRRSDRRGQNDRSLPSGSKAW